MAWEGQQAVREEQGSPTEKLTLLKGGGTGEGRGGAGGPGGGRPKDGAKKAKEGDRGVSGIARQGAQIHWKKRQLHRGTWLGLLQSSRGGQAGRFGGSMGRGQRGGE